MRFWAGEGWAGEGWAATDSRMSGRTDRWWTVVVSTVRMSVHNGLSSS